MPIAFERRQTERNEGTECTEQSTKNRKNERKNETNERARSHSPEEHNRSASHPHRLGDIPRHTYALIPSQQWPASGNEDQREWISL